MAAASGSPTIEIQVIVGEGQGAVGWGASECMPVQELEIGTGGILDEPPSLVG